MRKNTERRKTDNTFKWKKYSYLRISGFPDCLHIYINLLSLKILSNIWKYHHFLNFLPPDHLTISSQVSKTNIRELKKMKIMEKMGVETTLVWNKSTWWCYARKEWSISWFFFTTSMYSFLSHLQWSSGFITYNTKWIYKFFTNFSLT